MRRQDTRLRLLKSWSVIWLRRVAMTAKKIVGEQQLSYDVLEYFLDVQARGQAFEHHNYPVNQLFGVQNGYLRFMNEVHAVKIEGYRKLHRTPKKS